MSADQPTSVPPPGAKPLWGSYAATAQAVSPGPGGPSPSRASGSPVASQASRWISGGEPLEPLSRRLLQAAGFLSFLLVAVLANSFLQSSEENPLNPVAAAAERTQSEPGARFTMKVLYTSAALSQPMNAHGHGAYNSETGLGEVHLKLDTPGLGLVEFDTITDGITQYMRSEKEELMPLPDGKEWMKVDPLLGASEGELMAGGDADSSLDMLGAVGEDVTKVGRERVRGTETAHYRATVTLTDLAERLRDEGKDDLAELYEKYAALNPAPQIVEAWIDGNGIVRRMRMVMQLPIENQPTMTMDLRMDLFGFGAQPAITVPDEDQVFDATPALEEELDAVETD